MTTEQRKRPAAQTQGQGPRTGSPADGSTGGRPVVRLRDGSRSYSSRDLKGLYDDLRRLAASWFRSGGAPQTLQPTAVVNEALARLIAAEAITWQDRSHFMAAAATAMRHVLIDHARRQKARKRGGAERRQITLYPALRSREAESVDVLALDETLSRLAGLSQRQARVVELRVFGGLTLEEMSDVLGVSVGTIKSDWVVAKAWLKRELSEGS